MNLEFFEFKHLKLPVVIHMSYMSCSGIHSKSCMFDLRIPEIFVVYYRLMTAVIMMVLYDLCPKLDVQKKWLHNPALLLEIYNPGFVGFAEAHKSLHANCTDWVHSA